MGWLWSSKPSEANDDQRISTDEAASSKPSEWALTNEQRTRIFGKPGSLQDADRSRDVQADRELEAFLNSLSDTQSGPTPSQIPSSSLDPQTNHDRIRPDGSLNISPAAIYPRTMSCRQAFDQAFYCQSLGGKFNDIYRYGSIQSCSEQWGAFWFCMRTKALPDLERQRQISEYYAAREERKKKEFGSSESVWEIRDKPVQRAFGKDPDADDDVNGGSIRE